MSLLFVRRTSCPSPLESGLEVELEVEIEVEVELDAEFDTASRFRLGGPAVAYGSAVNEESGCKRCRVGFNRGKPPLCTTDILSVARMSNPFHSLVRRTSCPSPLESELEVGLEVEIEVEVELDAEFVTVSRFRFGGPAVAYGSAVNEENGCKRKTVRYSISRCGLRCCVNGFAWRSESDRQRCYARHVPMADKRAQPSVYHEAHEEHDDYGKRSV